MLATAPHCTAPGVSGLPLPPQLKRKRSNSSDPASDRDAPVATKLRADDAPSNPVSVQQTAPNVNGTTVSREPGNDSLSQPIPKSSHPSHPVQGAIASDSPTTNRDVSARKVDTDTLRETLEAQLSLEVLLKHDELRLIDQEIAKCQIALEQLRRCAEIPYPGSSVAGYSKSVSNGTGMAVWAPENGPAPQSPAPWGVENGPYSRHYSRWLLPDPRFDGGELDSGTPVAGIPMVEGRATRGSLGDLGYLAGKTRPQRGSGGMKLQSLPTGYSAPKEKAGPMLIRRKSDNVLVKLICLDCRRDNFSSTQGFINHCRIAHNRNFASHDAAAMASGEPVEVDEAGAVVGGKSETSSAATAGFVHPLIRSAHVIEPSSKTPSSASEATGDSATPPHKRSCPSRRASSGVETPRGFARPSPGKRATPATGTPSDSFMGSPATPHLSSLMQSRGVGLDLDRLVGEAKTAVDLGEYSSDEDESDPGSVPPPTEMSHEQTTPLGVRAGRQPMRTTASQATARRPGSRKGLDPTSHNPFSLESLTPTKPAPYESPYLPIPCSFRSTQMDELREVDGVPPNLSPNAVESNQAPSLVSDDDDYEAASDSESPGPSSSEAGDPEDFGHIDVEDDEDSTTSTAAPEAKPDMGMASGATPRPPLSKPLRRGSTKKKERVMSAPVQSASNMKKANPAPAPAPDATFDAAQITLSTFHTLLAHYPATVEALTRRKATAKILTPGRQKKTKGPASASNPDPDPAQQTQIQTEVDEFLRLDAFRYEELPARIRARAGSGDEQQQQQQQHRHGYLEKEELVRLVEWKMKHGIFRSALLGLIRSNPDNLVKTATAEAFTLLHQQQQDLSKPGDGDRARARARAQARTTASFPDKGLDALVKPLRGVGVATASLVLGLSGEVPFYSDDAYLWVCLGESGSEVAEGGQVVEERVKRGVYKRANGELDVKYNLKEYRGLWEEGGRVRERLRGDVSWAEVERAALVVRFWGLDGERGGGRSGEGGVEEQTRDPMKEEKEGQDGRRRSKRLRRG
ncbi:hypothetical protein BO71DRAFT_330703 [Aspergillus ellipticus CBS 707.79]|uniref:AHC1-like C2H2 zinc-finger domain-containing protein n=1 Tax=Aspergillus ellipticus CBS 707.79 TaxID=1448320 RepID=A0A319D3Q3_9EURO|nr:hypothetical protein BO71DRAFT_330703 [Aspergillus ellipticus CBS 707.79]